MECDSLAVLSQMPGLAASESGLLAHPFQPGGLASQFCAHRKFVAGVVFCYRLMVTILLGSYKPVGAATMWDLT